MEIDEITKRRIEKYLDKTWRDVISNPERKTQEFAGGMYCSALRILDILGIEIEGRNQFDE